MTTENEIISTFKTYSHAMYGPDWDVILDGLYPPDIVQLHRICMRLMELIEPFGEMKQFLSFFPDAKGPEDLRKLSPEAFARFYLSGATRGVPKEKMIELVETYSIDEVVVNGRQAKIKYSFPVTTEEETFSIERDADLIHDADRWYVRIQAGFEKVLEQFQYAIDLFNERKSRDALRPDLPDDDLEVYSLQGYCDWETGREVVAPHADLEEVDDEDRYRFSIFGYRNRLTGETVIEPRFKKAGEFREGIAPVRIFSRYGYIDKRAELVILPEYVRAGVFSEGLAPAALYDEELDVKYGYIDNSGAFVIPTQYDEARSFSEGMAAVRQGLYWGYVDKTGRLCIDFYFVEAGDYTNGLAYVEIDGENAGGLWIDRQGKVLKIP